MTASLSTLLDLRGAEVVHIVCLAFRIEPSATGDQYFPLILVESVHFLGGSKFLIVSAGS